MERDVIFVGRLLLGRVTGALMAAYDKALSPVGLTAQQGAILLNCARHEGNTAAKLADLNGLDVSTITRMVDRLEKKGLVTRTRSRKDRRQVVLRLTPKGRAVLREAIPVARRIALESWRGVTESEKKSFRSLISKILTNLGHTPGVLLSNNKSTS